MAHLEDARSKSAHDVVRRLMRPDRPKVWPSLVAAAVVLACWEWQVRAGGLSALFFPAPSTISLTLLRLSREGVLFTHLAATVSRVVLGMALGALPGLVLGLTMGWSRRLHALVDPVIAAAHPLPKIAVLPLVMIVFGIGEVSKLIVVAFAAFFPMLISTVGGVRHISPIHFDVAHNYGATSFQVLKRVVAPGSLPGILTGARLALNTALLVTIAVELVAAREGLGEMIWFSWQTMRTEELYAALFVIAALGILLNVSLQWLTRRLVPWHVEREG